MSQSLETSTTVPVAAAGPGVWATFRDAIRGAPLDYTTAPVGRAVIMLAVPMVIEMAMESIFAVADVFWVAHLGADAVATVGLTESMLTMIYTVAMGLSIGAMALVSRRIGQHDADGASRAAAQSILLGIVVAALIAVIAAPNAPALLRLMGASPAPRTSAAGRRWCISWWCSCADRAACACARSTCGSICRSCAAYSACRGPARSRSSSVRRATSASCGSCRSSGAMRSRATRSASG
jgi:hypothetical protein